MTQLAVARAERGLQQVEGAGHRVVLVPVLLQASPPTVLAPFGLASWSMTTSRRHYPALVPPAILAAVPLRMDGPLYV